MTPPGTVYLVGAGPGDPGLITVKGLECLRRADVIVYDYLANAELLEHASPAAERIYVGKKAGRHTLKQEEINALLVEHGLAGRTVVRLKGGDPFVFGRGGEEALALRQAGVPFEVVPAVTSGIAAPAYAGIPVTHRGINAVVSFVTGHEDPDKETSSVDWESLARGGGTLVFYMGVGNLPAIVEKLTACGRPRETPVALVGCGTLPEQTVVEGTLATIVERVRDAGLRPPAITVIGEVVRLRQQIDWFGQRPLVGRTVLIPRTRTQPSALACELTRLGARVLSLPTTLVQGPADEAPLQRAVDALGGVDWVLFGSPHAVDGFFDVLDRKGLDARCLAGCEIAATGPATADALWRRGLRPDLVPLVFTPTALAEAVCRRTDLRGKQVLLPNCDSAPTGMADILRRAGAVLVEVEACRTLPAPPDPALVERFRARGIDVVPFTSSTAVRQFAAVMRPALGQLPDTVKYVSIGPETSKAARDAGLQIAAEATQHTIAGLAEILVACAENGIL